MPRFTLVFLGKSCILLIVMLILSAPGLAQLTPQGITQWSTQIQAGPVYVDMQAGTMQMRIPVLNRAPLPPTRARPFWAACLPQIVDLDTSTSQTAGRVPQLLHHWFVPGAPPYCLCR